MNAQQLKNSILQEAIEGRLVPQDPNDEPASVLLDRIRKEKARLVKEGKLKKKDLEETPISEDEKPFDIPDSWEWCRIRDIFIINPKVSGNDEDDVAFIPMEKIVACYGSKYTYDIRKWKDVKSSFTSFADGDVAFAKITPCFQNRKSMILQNLPNGIGAGTTELKVLRQYSETIDRKYLLYFLASSYFVEEASFKGTANQQRIVVGYLENKLFPLPPLAEQHRIVAKIEELLPKVEEYGKAQEALDKLNEELPEQLKKSILQEAIEGRLVPQDPNDEPASVLLDIIRKEKAKLVKEGKLKKKDLVEIPIAEDEKPFEIPESWEWHRIGFLASLYTGNSISKDVKESKYINVKGRWYIGTKDVNFDNTINYDNGVYIPEKEEQQFKIAPSGSILMCIEGGSAGRKIGIIDRDVCFGNKLCCFLSYGIFNMFIYYYLQSSNFKEIFNDNKKGIIGGVSINMMSPLLIPVPPLAEQHRIVEKIEQLMKEIDKLKV